MLAERAESVQSPVAERDSHSFETKWREKGMCEHALVGALPCV